MHVTFVVDFNNESDVLELRDLMNWKLTRMESPDHVDDEDTEMDAENPNRTPTNNIEVLNRFIQQASTNQITVLRWMKEHPGEVSAHVLKEELPFLAPPGTIPGVFRPGRWIRLTGGTKAGFPFFQVRWNHEQGCGIYRGITEEEAADLDI